MTVVATAESAEDALLSSLANKIAGDEKPRIHRDTGGRITFLGAPPGNGFSATVKGRAEDIAASFVKQHSAAFGLSTASDFDVLSTHHVADVECVRLEQMFAGIPVFASAIAVQTTKDGLVRAVHNDTALVTPKLGFNPQITSERAADQAKAWAVEAHDGHPAVPTGSSDLVIFAPSVLDLPGDTRLAWMITLRGAGGGVYCDRVLVDAVDGRILFDYPLLHSARNRRIYDAANQYLDPAVPARQEGGGTSPVVDVNRAYNFSGDTHAFYASEHGRDSLDDEGISIDLTVRYCDGYCPWPNAHWDGELSRMRFGSGFVTDDVVAHEYTHGVTQSTSGLIYYGQSGALNESLSDIWGEFVDLTNGRGTDTPSVRWLVGEDLEGGAIRNMSVPGAFAHPGTTCSQHYYTGSFDSGGVHTNSGVPNKLAYLLTDGNAFNGEVVYGMGIQAVAKLLYTVQTTSLTPGSNFTDFYAGLTQAAINLGFSETDRANVSAAARAVQITPETTCQNAPDNDHCENATALLVDTPTAGTNLHATGLLDVVCKDKLLYETADVWFTFTVPTSGYYDFSLCDLTDYDATLTLFSGPCPSILLEACDDDACGSLGGPASFTAWLPQNASYYVRVSGWGGAQGNFTLLATRLDATPEIEGEGAAHSLDGNANGIVSLSELLRAIQLFNALAHSCAPHLADTEDGYQPGPGHHSCPPHDMDYQPLDWQFTLTELLRGIQLYNAGSYRPCPNAYPPTEDGFCPSG